MRQAALFIGIAVIFLSGIQRSPAPVIEEQEKPSPSVAPKPKVVIKPKPKPTPITFAGTWSGTADSVCSNDGVHHSSVCTLTISANEGFISWQQNGQNYQHVCYRSGDTIRWDDASDVVTTSSTIHISRDGKTLTYAARSTITTWPMEGVVCTGTGTLTKR